MTPAPSKYQLVGRDFLASKRHALLADEMRVRKSRQAIMAAHKVNAKRIQVVCPAIAVEHWHREFAKWWEGDTLPQLKVRSYDRLRLDWDSIKDERFDVSIADECHFARNPNAQRTKLIYGKNGIGWNSDRLWVLSGTPAPKHAGELWPMLRAFGVVAMDYDWFVARYCVVNKFTQRIVGTKTGMIPELKELLAKVMLRRTRREVAPEMPDISYDFLEIPLVESVDLQIPSGLSEAQLAEWLEANAGVDREDRIEVAAAKAPAVVDHIKFDIGNSLLQQTVVFGWHTEPLELLARMLNEAGIRTELLTGRTTQKQRERIQLSFRGGETQVIVGNILAAGTAIDLSAASHGFFLELDWVPANNVQAANRLVALDKKEPVTYDVASCTGSVDERVQKVLIRRTREINQLY